mmetsp:Transcript_171401/g.416779  ORF Transcript_171401/g.416779 Transcript_171401/m.416779 type:complete len:207 (-) Transcript_171401:35-655(-)
MPDYGNPSYWDERYAADDSASFDWYQSYETLRPVLAPHLRKEDSFEIFVPGCGNSPLSASLYEDGYMNISNIDSSNVVISQMSERYSEYKEMDFSVLDATRMDRELPDECFDAVIDKALLDCLLCGDDSVKRVSAMVSEMYRILKPGGTYICVSYGTPSMRVGYLKGKHLDWDIEHQELEKPKLEHFTEVGAAVTHFVYICHKPAR